MLHSFSIVLVTPVLYPSCQIVSKYYSNEICVTSGNKVFHLFLKNMIEKTDVINSDWLIFQTTSPVEQIRIFSVPYFPSFFGTIFMMNDNISIVCDSCGLECKSTGGFTRHLNSSVRCNIDFRYLNNIQYLSTPTKKSKNYTLKPYESKFSYYLEEKNNTNAIEEYIPIWDTRYMDSHLQPFVNNQSDKELLFISDDIQNSISIQNLCNSNYLQEDDLLHIDEIDDDDVLECFTINNYEYDYLDDNSETNMNYPNCYENHLYEDNSPGMQSHEELFSLELFNLLSDANSPNYVYDKVMTLVKKYLSLGMKNISTNYSIRNNVVRHFSTRFNMDGMKPRVKNIKYKEKTFPLVTWNAEQMIMSVMKDSDLFNDDNLIFPTTNGDPFGILDEKCDFIGDIHTSKAYLDAYKKLQVDKEKDLPVGLMFYLDKITLDKHGHLSIDPVQFTLSILNRKARKSSNAWRPFGYIPNISHHSKAESKHSFKAEEKAHFTHILIENILSEYKEIEDNGICNYQFYFREKLYTVNLKFFVLVILGDTECHDKLCGHFNCRNLQVKNICRHCNIPSNMLDDPKARYKLTSQKFIDQLVLHNDIKELKQMSQYNFHSAWYKLNITFGGNPRGIHGVTPSEPLHMIDLGIFKYLVEVFFQDIGPSECKIHSLVDSWAKRVGRFMQHQSDKNLPRTYYPNGISGVSKLNGHEYIGVILVLFVLLRMDGPRRTFFQYNVSKETTEGWSTIFELCICWRKWLQRESISKEELLKSEVAHEKLLSLILKYCNRIDGNQWKIIKFHMITHIVSNIFDFGVPGNIDTSAPESNHKYNIKRPAGNTQCRASLIEIQTATRYYENLVMSQASKLLIPRNKMTKEIGTPGFIDNMAGSKFQIIGENNREGNDVDSVHIHWATKEVKATYPMKYIKWLGKHLISKIGNNVPINGFTEYHRDKLIFRAHPNYKNTGGWYDWALFKWVLDDKSTIEVPGQIVMFLDLPEPKETIELDNRSYIEHGGLYALVESCASAMKDMNKRNRIHEIKDKQVSVSKKKKKVKEISDKCLYLVSVDTINNALCAIPNLGNNNFEFVILRPSTEWHKGFTMFINECN